MREYGMSLRTMWMAAAGAGVLAIAAPAWADGTPECNNGPGTLSTECGANAQTIGFGSTAVGGDAYGGAQETTVLGLNARATSQYSTVIGSQAFADGESSTAIGSWAATPEGNITVLRRSLVQGRWSTAVGAGAWVRGDESTAVGTDAGVARDGGARTNRGTAIGISSRVAGGADNGTALGAGAEARFAGSTALGAGTVTDRAQQMKLGGAGTSVTLGDLAASTAAQTGPLSLMTVDASGTVGQDTTILTGINASIAGLQATGATHTGQIAQIQTVNADQDARIAAHADQIAGVQAVNVDQDQRIGGLAETQAEHTSQIADIQGANAVQDHRIGGLEETQTGHTAQIAAIEAVNDRQTGQIAALQTGQAALLGMAEANRRDIRTANEGVAIALAMDTPTPPPGTRFALAGGVGYFRNQTAVTTAFAARVSQHMSLSAGVGVGFDSGEVGARAGFQVAW